MKLVAMPATGEGAPVLSIILPYFRKLADFRRVLPLNAPFFARPGIEVLLVLDEPSEEHALLELLKAYRDIRWRVFVNDLAHLWRPPCRAINVGIRQARGEFILVCSPESAFVTDVPAIALRSLLDKPRSAVLGQVGFGLFSGIQQWSDLQRAFVAAVPDPRHLNTFYGSVCAPKAAFEEVRGYDESFDTWGSDDDNLRVRMEMAGYANLLCPSMRVLHLADEPREPEGRKFNAAEAFQRRSPTTALANSLRWGTDFGRLAYQWPPPAEMAAPAPGLWSEILLAAIPGPSTVVAGSKRQCPACARAVHYTRPLFACRTCGVGLESLAHRPGRRPKVACVMQLHNEERNLPGCLRHIRDHVDGIIALDDGSTDATAEILAREDRVVDCLRNPADPGRQWNELENKRRLLVRARQLGFDWVVVCDADERFEYHFLQQMGDIAASFPESELPVFSLTFRELWGDPLHFRTDGLWGRKRQGRFFRLPEIITFGQNQAFHGDWFPDVLRAKGRLFSTGYQQYHLKMIFRDDRIKRRDFYKSIDPENRFQPFGYDYLAEEGEEVRLQRIAPGREYAFESLPEDLRAFL